MEQRPLLHLSVVAIEKGAFESPSTMVANFSHVFFWLGFGDTFVFENPKESYASNSLGRILVCAYDIWQNGRILISLQTPISGAIEKYATFSVT